MSISRRCAITHRRAGTGGVAGIQRNLLHFYTSGTTGKPKGVQRDVGGYRWRWRPRWTPFLAAKRAVCSLCFGYWLGGGAFVYRLRAAVAGMATIVYEGLPTWPDCGVGGKSSRNIRLAGCSQRRPPLRAEKIPYR